MAKSLKSFKLFPLRSEAERKRERERKREKERGRKEGKKSVNIDLRAITCETPGIKLMVGYFEQNTEQIRQSRPDFGLGFQVTILKVFQLVPC